jgi:stage II sporulation protein D
MKRIAIGLAAYDAKDLAHRSAELSANGPATIFLADRQQDSSLLTTATTALASIPAGTNLMLSATGNNLNLSGVELTEGQLQSKILIKPSSPGTHFFVQLLDSARAGRSKRTYTGEIVVLAQNSSVLLFVQCSLEEYLRGVLHSEIPATYHLEAIKAQAIAARTYALNSRNDHRPDHCHVCDSFLCCQAFLGIPAQNKGPYTEAIDQTKGQVLTYQDKPILAFFSSSAGGHTENYESCFSDIHTNAFPPEPVPYLKGVAEGHLPSDFHSPPDEKALASVWNWSTPTTFDGWAPQFRWSVNFPVDLLEASMHHVIDKMLGKSELAPFVIPPQSAIFGQVKSFEIQRRGVGGTAISMAINTSKGIWVIQKEIVIRSVFENHEIKLPRLRSARIYFEHRHDASGNLLSVNIFGLGSGHGVGLQQTGSEGLARRGKNCQAILDHYYKGTDVSQI